MPKANIAEVAARFMSQASSSNIVKKLGILPEAIRHAANRVAARYESAVTVTNFDQTRLFVRPVSAPA
jgi:hypothetical protein